MASTTGRRAKSDEIPGGPAGSDQVPVTDLGYTAAGEELDGIIAEFEGGMVDVDRLVERLQRASDIVDELDRRLRRTRSRVEELVPRLEAVGSDGLKGAEGEQHPTSVGGRPEGLDDQRSEGDRPPPGLF